MSVNATQLFEQMDHPVCSSTMLTRRSSEWKEEALRHDDKYNADVMFSGTRLDWAMAV